MKIRKLSPIGAAFAALVLLVVFFVARGTLHRSARVVLPEETEIGTEGDAAVNDASAGRVVVRPDTVQSAIATLERPTSYTRTITIERYYGDGSGTDRCTVAVDGAWMRADTESSGGDVSHAITNGESIWLWYGSGTHCYQTAAAFSADEEQGIPTYEEVLALDVSRIALADYRLLETTDCIFVETAADEDGYVERYWISVGTGLLCAAEKLCGEEVVYRMAGMTVESGTPAVDVFTLPDGTVLHEEENHARSAET